MTNRFAAVAAGATILALVGCGSTTEPAAESDTSPAATELESDNTFTLYSGRDEALIQPLIDQFEASSGIEVDVRYGNTAELGALLLEEGEQTPAQVFLSQDAGALGALSSAGLFTTLPEDVTAAVPAGFTSTDDSWVGVTGRARVIVYDGEALGADDVPVTVDELTDPEWSGRVGFAPSNASFQAFITAYRVLKGEEAADEWVAALAANDPQIFENNGAVLTAVNEGVVETGLINHYYWFRQAAETGEENMRAQLSYPEAGDPGSIVNVTGAGILSNAGQDADALEFVEFLVSADAQQYFVEETFEYPLAEGAEAPEGLPALDSLVNPDLDLSDLESLEQTQELLSKHGLI
ncbi:MULTISPECIES: iron ABC transporter substrate-binding protein [unclassified Arthrobacter]|uniref:iron ABC transporter substrate-binding protein n=1 Tax=unclassified Arthrobacter TaxID=235627 RepID=UPI0014924A3C|nr:MULTISPECIES: iron ABC transporter substrate-binding protein [unclassified Arthrobacter]MBE0008204.1 iron ABC transporter substrate-binding protein [Arthrobacter sp. AET 35A]NOJ60551.1 iron ABC transporter substrate-binding protein [Arthrobacter sp. 260]NOJ61943.1 iron ABC transporter substrate-binding protein [Arthrobacter sp. 147(2020)]